VERRFFLRASEYAKETIINMLKGGKKIELEERRGDFGIVTEPMTEKEFYDICNALGDAVLGKVRIL
jgi:hypothetical protein